MRRTTLLIASLLILGLTPSAEADDGILDMESQGPPQCGLLEWTPLGIDYHCLSAWEAWIRASIGNPPEFV